MNYILQLSGFFNGLRLMIVSTQHMSASTWRSFSFGMRNVFRIRYPYPGRNLCVLVKYVLKQLIINVWKTCTIYGYIQYLPSFNPFKGSLVYLFDMQSSAKLVSTHDRTNIETSIEQALAPYINKENILNLNIENEEARPQNDIVLKVSKKEQKWLR